MHVHRGITRTVLLVGRWAVKVPSLRSYNDGVAGVLWSISHGVQANLSERTWSGSDAGYCPVLWSLAGLVNVYPRCAPVDPAAVIDYDAVAEWNCPTDRKPENLGWLDGRLVWVDYDMSWNDCPHGHPARPLIAADEEA